MKTNSNQVGKGRQRCCLFKVIARRVRLMCSSNRCAVALVSDVHFTHIVGVVWKRGGQSRSELPADYYPKMEFWKSTSTREQTGSRDFCIKFALVIGLSGTSVWTRGRKAGQTGRRTLPSWGSLELLVCWNDARTRMSERCELRHRMRTAKPCGVDTFAWNSVCWCRTAQLDSRQTLIRRTVDDTDERANKRLMAKTDMVFREIKRYNIS